MFSNINCFTYFGVASFDLLSHSTASDCQSEWVLVFVLFMVSCLLTGFYIWCSFLLFFVHV